MGANASQDCFARLNMTVYEMNQIVNIHLFANEKRIKIQRKRISEREKSQKSRFFSLYLK